MDSLITDHLLNKKWMFEVRTQACILCLGLINERRDRREASMLVSGGHIEHQVKINFDTSSIELECLIIYKVV